jgi:two-component system nitrogen regulation response regulator GlnG
MPTLLVVDDEPAILHAFRRVFREPEVTLLTSGSALDGIEVVQRQSPDVIILDVHLPDLSGLEALRRIRKLDSRVPVIVITGHGTTETAIEATKLGALDYLYKPLELAELRKLVNRAFEVSRQMRVVPMLESDEPGSDRSDAIVGRCTAMKEVYQAIGRVAPQNVTVLILGESGTGKELVARAIYHHSQRSQGPFLAVNCAAIPESLLESELFGHEKGAFTGADRQRVGRFEQTSGGTLFLDEIGDMTPLTQAKILRVLQEQQFERVGGNEPVKADVRVVAATNRDLERMVAQGQFRADLYYRLSVFRLCLPPLRERGEDLRTLTEHYVRRFARALGKDVSEIDPEVHVLLRQCSWPGNIRELQSVLKQALLSATGPVLTPDFLPPALFGPAAGITSPQAAERGTRHEWERFVEEHLSAGSRSLYADWLEVTDRYLLSRVLQHTGGNLSRAAEILGINRRTLRARIRILGLTAD